MATINEIKQQAAAVKNATQVGENTAERVGGVLAGLADIAEQQDSKLRGLSKEFPFTNSGLIYSLNGSNNVTLNVDGSITINKMEFHS